MKSDDWSSIESKMMRKIVQMVQDDAGAIDRWVSGETLAKVITFENSIELKEHDQRVAAARQVEMKTQLDRLYNNKRGGPHDRQDRLGGPKSPFIKKEKEDRGGKGPGPSRDGDIIFTGAREARMPMPKYPEGTKKACPPAYRQGAACRYGAECKFDHTSIDSLAVNLQKLWHAHVKATEGTTFNISRVKSGVNAVNDAVKTAPSTAKADKE